MKETVKTSRTAGYLEKIFRALNAKYFNGELEEPIITIQSTPRAYGHVTVAKAWQRGDTTRHELNIGAGTLARPIENVVATTLHECVHLWNLQNGIQDCSRGGQYHNKKFKEAAEARDLKISYDPRIGWSITEPTDALCEFILEQGWQDIEMNRIESAYIPRGKGTGDNTDKPTGNNPNSHSIQNIFFLGLQLQTFIIIIHGNNSFLIKRPYSLIAQLLSTLKTDNHHPKNQLIHIPI